MAHSNERRDARLAKAELDRLNAEAVQRAVEIVELWNARLKARQEPFFMPTIRGALLARTPWLLVDCKSCGLVIDLDLRVKPRPGPATVLMAMRDVKCPRCNGHGRPVLEGLSASGR
jgi:hypothetical protein